MKPIGKGLLCAIGGTVGWLVTAPLFPRDINDPAGGRAEYFYILFVCSLIGGAAGYWQGRQRTTGQGALFSGLLGLVFGAVGGFLGSGLGGGMANALLPQVDFLGPIEPGQIVKRTIYFCFLGALLGGAVGATLKSWRGAVSGLVGGALGGILAGISFDVIGQAVAPFIMGPPSSNRVESIEVGVVSRGLSSAILGFGIGLFTALVEMATRRAWLRLELGRNEGREWPLDAGRTMIGRDERAHIPLFADPQLPPLAAVIERQGAQYILVDPGSPIGIGLNGYRVAAPTPLSPNDQIQVGSLTLRFDMKQGAARQAAEGRAKAQPLTPITGGTPVTASPAPTMTIPTAAPVSAGAGTGLALVAQSGPMAGQRVPISAPTEIGRDAQGLRLSWDSQASRRHALVAPAPGGLQVTDLNSTNGTLVNGERVTSVLVGPGQSVQIGSTVFLVSVD